MKKWLDRNHETYQQRGGLKNDENLFFGVVIAVLVIILILAIIVGIRESEKFRAACDAVNGRVLDLYKRQDLCLSEDGRVINLGRYWHE